MYLALLIITFSYNNLQFYLSDAKIIGGNMMYATFYIPIGSLIPVFIINYVREFVRRSKDQASGYGGLLYVPFCIFLILAIALKIDSISELGAVRKPLWQNVGKVQSLFSFLYTLSLIGVSSVLIHKKVKTLKKDKKWRVPEARWLNVMLFILFLLTLMWGVALFKYLTNMTFRNYFTALWISLSLAIYWLGHIGIYKYGVREERKNLQIFSKKLKETSFVKKSSNGHISKIEDIIRSEKKYLDPNFSAEQLSEKLQLSTSHLSRIFNNEMNTSFSEYINSLRVEEAKRYLQNPAFSNYTLLAIGLEAGFNSKTTFNTTFKKMTGQTPSQFKKAN